ncbi:AAA family ATPase [Tumebacillus flagellatus]|uniref:Nuclease SbcCD subunit C n=1 Tax=Tumebacillus flagellatus TaxID=1157490 RepID=A0A074MG75_9BACL|nr:AAA family ATPase [Tumebacillus flagellatus]KEO84707.1 hypothetical protein EL26_04095 [Tumebacillus flagellatus]
MIIKKMILNNFMAYYGEVGFEFPLTADRNVTIIYAPNDVGKTCFFNGIMFCLYGPQKGSDLKELINQNAIEEGKYEAYVSIIAEHEGNQLNITRTIRPKGIIKGQISSQNLDHQLGIWKNGEAMDNEPREAYDFINSIIHEDAAKYFFFDGEKIDAYNIASGADYKEAILRILGIKEIEFAISDFRTLVKEYENSRDALLVKETKGAELIKKRQGLLSEIEQYENDITIHKKELKEIQSRIVKREDELKKYEEIKSKIEERQQIRDTLKDLRDRAVVLDDEKMKVFRENGTMILGSILANELKPTIAELVGKPLTVLPSKEFLSQILKGDVCVCGEILTEQHIGHINDLIESLKDKDVEWQRTLERQRAIQGIDMFAQHSINAKAQYNDLCTKKVAVNREINTLEEREIELRSEVGNYNEQAVQRSADEIARLEAKGKETELKIERFNTLMEVKNKDLNELENEIAKYTVSKEKQEAEKRVNFARKTVEALTEYQERLIDQKRKDVEKWSSEIFLQLTNKPKKYKSLKLSSTYQLMIEHADGSLFEIERGRSLNPSTGQSKIISLSYIAGINKSTNSVAPVIIDNPVGLFSEEHRERVVNYLPQFGRQVIFMVTGADLGKEYQDIIKPFVNREYHLEDRADGIWNKTQIVKVD